MSENSSKCPFDHAGGGGEWRQNGKGAEVRLFEGPVDYDDLVQKIFASDKVLSWW